MNGREDRIEDVRPVPLVRIDAAAFDLIPVLGPVTWTVYTYLVLSASRPGGVWPGTNAIAMACGFEPDDVEAAIETLIEQGMIGRHRWTSHPARPVTYTVLPVPSSVHSPRIEVSPSAEPPFPQHPIDDVDIVEEEQEEPVEPTAPDLAPEDPRADQVDTAWFEQAREKRLARRLFSSFVSALGGEPTELSEVDRERIRIATELVSEAGGTPEQVQQLAQRINELQPDAHVDPVWIAEHWLELTRDLQGRDDENA